MLNYLSQSPLVTVSVLSYLSVSPSLSSCAALSYVRKNAVLTVFTVYSAHPDLIPDAPELIEQFLYAETNPSAKRNAFLMLYHCNEDKAVTYLDTCINTINGTGEAFQLIALELIRKVCRTNPTLKAAYIRAIFTLVNSPVHAVSFEGANTLVALSSAPTAVRAAVSAYTNLLSSESENNVKLVILQRLSELRNKNERILQEMLMDILRTLSSPNMEIRKQTLSSRPPPHHTAQRGGRDPAAEEGAHQGRQSLSTSRACSSAATTAIARCWWTPCTSVPYASLTLSPPSCTCSCSTWVTSSRPQRWTWCTSYER